MIIARSYDRVPTAISDSEPLPLSLFLSFFLSLSPSLSLSLSPLGSPLSALGSHFPRTAFSAAMQRSFSGAVPMLILRCVRKP